MTGKTLFEDIVIGKFEEVNFEDRLAVLTAFVIAILSFIATFFNVFLQLGIITYFTLGGTLFGLIIYLFGRIRSGNRTIKWLVNIFTLVYLDALWYFNYGSQGPILFLYILYYALIMFAWTGRLRQVFLFLYFFNTLVLFAYELKYTDHIGVYSDHAIRIIDVYSGIVLYLVGTSFLFMNLKNNLIKERERARESDRLKSAFLSNVSHEIRTPMNAIMGFSGLLKLKKDMPDKVDSYSKLIHENANYLMNLLNDILDISMLESDQIKLNYSEFGLQELFDEISYLVNDFRKRIDSKVHISFSCGNNDFIIHSDRTRLKEILINLLTNSIKFTNTGKITYSCEKLDNKVLFKVFDTGIGIREKDQEKLFEPFNKYDPDFDRDYRGTGLGLALSKRLVEKLQGTMWFESREGVGTTFWIAIPIINSQ